MIKPLLLLTIVLPAYVAHSRGSSVLLKDKVISDRSEMRKEIIDSLPNSEKKANSPLYSLSAGAVAASKNIPFWMRANQYGSVPLSGMSGFLTGRIEKKYKAKRSIIDWGFAVEGRLNGGSRARFILPEGYVKARLGIFEFRAGRSRQIMGLVDSTLSVGAFAISGNALGVPKLELSIPEFYTLPILGDLMSIKGNFVHGWLGKQTITSTRLQTEQTEPVNTFFHQKSFYARLGKTDGKLKLYGGFNHQVFWGNERKTYGRDFTISNWESFKYVFFGKTMKKAINGFEKGKIGNHLGSIDLGGEVSFKNFNLFAYRQTFYDVGALSKLANIKDGLNGIRIQNRKLETGSVYWKTFLFEFLYTQSQAGELTAKATKSGDENYYNGFYKNGWSYKGLALGTPFISTKTSTRAGFPNDPLDYFINNRVSVYNLGAEIVAYGLALTGKFSYSINYGTYGTSAIGHSRGRIRHRSYGLFPKSNQFSGLLEIKKDLSNGLQLGCTLAADQGELLYNSAGIMFNVRKTFR